jgi:hypothetical protein
MARIEWVHHRLERWAKWRATGRSTGGAGCHPMWRQADSGDLGQRESVVPINDLECASTEASIKLLEAVLAETLVSYYLQDAERTRRRMHISSATLSQRITEAHRLLAAAWTTPKPDATYNLHRTWDAPKA